MNNQMPVSAYLQERQKSTDKSGIREHFFSPFEPLLPLLFEVQNMPLILQLHLLPGSQQSDLHLHFPEMPTTLYNNTAVYLVNDVPRNTLLLFSSIDSNALVSFGMWCNCWC